MSQDKIWVCLATARRRTYNGLEVSSNIYYYRFRTLREAMGEAILAVKRSLPENEGWENHKVDVTELLEIVVDWVMEIYK